MKKLLSFLLLMFSFSAFASEEGIVAIVNDHAITKTDVQKRIDFIIKSSGFDKSQVNNADLKQHVLNMIVDEILIEDDAKKADIKLDEIDLHHAFISLAEKNGVPPQKFNDLLKAKGIDRSVLDKQISNQILMSKIIKSEIAPKIFVSDKEVLESKAALIKALNSHSDEKVLTQVKLAEIVIYPESEEALKSSMNIARNIVKQARSGKTFANLANEFSQSPTAENGGVIGWIYINQIIPELAMNVVGKPVGHVSEALLLEDGIHIIKLLDVKFRHNNTPPVTEVDDETLKEMLHNKKLDLQIKNYLRKLRKSSYVHFN